MEAEVKVNMHNQRWQSFEIIDAFCFLRNLVPRGLPRLQWRKYVGRKFPVVICEFNSNIAVWPIDPEVWAFIRTNLTRRENRAKLLKSAQVEKLRFFVQKIGSNHANAVRLL